MKRGFRKTLGAFLFLIGVIMLSASQSGITGNIISDRTGAVGSILSLILIVGGLALMAKVDLEKLSKTTSTGEDIIMTNRFKKSIRKHDLDLISNAINKIGTGKGKEHKLKGYEDKYALKVAKGARLIFDKINGNISLNDYLPSHEYDRLYG